MDMKRHAEINEKVREDYRRLLRVFDSAWAVLDEMRETAGGDAYEYQGSMAQIELLRKHVDEVSHNDVSRHV